MFLNRFLVAFLLIFWNIYLLTGQAFLDPPPVEWGKISASDFEIDSKYLVDDPALVVICNFGQIYTTNNALLIESSSFANVETVSDYVRTDIHVRLKILNDDGLSKQNLVVNYYSDDNREHIEKMEACSYTLASSGEIIKTETNQESAILTESGNSGFSKLTLNIPDVRVGSIIEYRYSRIEHFTLTEESWTFQGSYPIIRSEFRIAFPQNRDYAVIRKGLLADQIHAEKSSLCLYNPGRTYDHVMKYWLTDIPALPDQPFVMSMNNYLTSVSVQLSKYYNWKTNENVSIISTWEALSDALQVQDNVGRQLNRSPELIDQLALEFNQETDDYKRAKACYEYTQHHFVWNKETHRVPQQTVRQIIDSKTGSNADINLFLIALLRECNLDANYALISTRDNGWLNENYPFLNQFNSMVCEVKIKDQYFFIDASYPCCPFGTPPSEIIECRAMVAEKKGAALLTVDSGITYDKQVVVSITVTPDSLTGKIQNKYQGYAAIEERNLFLNDSAHYFQNTFESEDTPNLVKTMQVNAQQYDKPFLTQVDFNWKIRIPDEDKIQFAPFDFFGNYANPFQTDKRQFPVELNFPLKTVYKYTIMLPDGYKPEKLPKNINTTMPDQSASVIFNYQLMGNMLMIQAELIIDKIEFSPEEYTNLKTIYELWENKHSETIDLKKITDS